MTSFHKQFLSNIFLFSSAVLSLRGETKNVRRQLKTPKQCNDIPARIRYDGNIVNFVTLYSAVFAEGNTSGLESDILCDEYINAYSAKTNCSAIFGSYREVGSCDVVTDASGPEASFLLKLNYFTNVLEGSTLYTAVAETEGECICSCPHGVIAGIFANNTCTCVCEPHDVDCKCDPPFVGDVVSDLDARMASSEFHIVDALQLVLLDLENCNSTDTTYDYNYVCPGSETAAFAYLDTEFPSEFPTLAPSVSPTSMPSEFPSEFPSEYPTDFPTVTPSPTVFGAKMPPKDKARRARRS